MLLAAIACDDPTLVIENRGLYFGAAESIEIDGAIEPAEGAKVAREGTDITIVSWGSMLLRVLQAAQDVQSHGVSVEVINARWVAPFDWATLNTSVRKTRRFTPNPCCRPDFLPVKVPRSSVRSRHRKCRINWV